MKNIKKYGIVVRINFVLMLKYNTCPITGASIDVPNPPSWFTINNRKKPFKSNQKPRGKKVPVRGIRKIGSKPAQKGT